MLVIIRLIACKRGSQIVTEFLQSFIVALNSLSTTYRISQLPSQATVLANQVACDNQYAGTWKERFGFEIIKVAIANINSHLNLRS